MTITVTADPADLRAANPAEVDETLADLHAQLDEAAIARNAAADELHRLVGERRTGADGHDSWPTLDYEAVLKAVRLVQLGGANAADFTIEVKAREALRIYAEQDNLIATIAARIGTLDAEYARRPWPRYFTGEGFDERVHGGRWCSTGTGIGVGGPGRRLAWRPDVAGANPPAAARVTGRPLCPACFPNHIADAEEQ